MLSISHQQQGRPVPVLRWSRQTVRRVEAIRDRIMGMCESPEPVIDVPDAEFAELGARRVTMQWRKPLGIYEVAQMAPTPEVRERKGRP